MHATAECELAPGERKEVLTLEPEGVDAERALLTVTLDGTSTSRLLCEPKDACLPRAELRAHFAEGSVEIESAAPVIDLFLWTDDPACRFADNFLTLPAPGTLRFRCAGRPKRLFARSLAGVHTVTLGASASARA